MTIRLATQDDAKDVANVQVRAWRTGYDKVIAPEILAALDPAEREAQWMHWSSLASSTSFTLVEVTSEGLTGFCRVAAAEADDFDPVGVIEVRALYVDPSSWRMGTATRLLDSVITRIALRGYRDLMLWTIADLPSTRRFYAARGFLHDDAHKVGWGVPLVRLWKKIEPRHPEGAFDL